MDRLLNIGREDGFPICAETFSVLNENSEMLNSFLQALPGMARSAIMFGNYLFVSDARSHTHRIIKVGSVETDDFENCELVISTSTHSVTDSSNNEFSDVWKTETADIVAAAQGEAKWRILRFEDVFELNIWQNLTEEFAALLPSASIQGNGGFVNVPSMAEGNNTLRVSHNGTRIQLDFAINIDIYAYTNTVLRIPVPFECRNGVRLNANLKDSTNSNFPVRAVVKDGRILINIGQWLRDIGWTPEDADVMGYEHCIDVITINQEILCI